MSYTDKGYVFPKGPGTVWKPPHKSSVHYVAPENETWDEWLVRATWDLSAALRIEFNRAILEKLK